MRGFPRTTLLSALLSVASMGGTVGSCTMNQWNEGERTYQAAPEPARFCYNTLGEVSCFTAPQPHLGQVVAMEPEKISEQPETIEVEREAPAAVPAAAKAPAAPAKPTPPAPALAPGHDAPLNPPKKDFPSEPISLSPDYPKPPSNTPPAVAK